MEYERTKVRFASSSIADPYVAVSATFREHLPLDAQRRGAAEERVGYQRCSNEPGAEFSALREAAFAAFFCLWRLSLPDVGKVIPAWSMHFLKIAQQNTSQKLLAFHDISRRYTEHCAAYRVNTHV